MNLTNQNRLQVAIAYGFPMVFQWFSYAIYTFTLAKFTFISGESEEMEEIRDTIDERLKIHGDEQSILGIHINGLT